MKIGIFSIIFSILLITLLATGCTTSQQRSNPVVSTQTRIASPSPTLTQSTPVNDYILYTSANNDFTILHPSNWDLTTTSTTILNKKVPIVGFGSPDKLSVVMIMSINGISPSISVDNWATQFMSQATSSWSDFKIVNSTTTSINGVPAKLIEFNGTGPSGKQTHNLYLISIDRSTAYVVSYGSTQSSYSKHVDEGKYMLNSFKFL